MTSRPELLQRTASGGAHLAPNRGRPPPAAAFSSIPNQRHTDAVIDLTGADGDKRQGEGLAAGKTRTPRPNPRNNVDGKPTFLNGAAMGPIASAKMQARGRPPMYFDDGSRNEFGSAMHPAQLGQAVKNDGSPATLPSLAVPFPPRPGAYLRSDWAKNDGSKTLSSGEVRRNLKSSNFEAPQEAMVFPNGKSIDFFPWMGNHPEDSLTEALVKTGFANKPQIMNENGTARPAVWSHLKNKSGLQTLSSLFVVMLEKRQAAGRLTAPSSFKPPPRVTLTDTKREAWLRDLANPAVALRRLSRTIPHGIRGKILLEQCLSKNIPTARAVWLAKCVGANEMRAFKRKGATGNVGVGSEVKWMKEWTIFVEQFVESTIAGCGQPEWKAKMDYAIRLASHLYSDHLLDSDHYLDWILSSFESSTSEKLPIWLLLIRIYWRDLTASRRRGSRLAEIVFAHARNFTDVPEDSSEARLRRNIDGLILVLLKAHRKCLLLPKSWSSHLPVVHALLSRYPKIELGREMQHVQRQNERLLDGRALGAGSLPSKEKELLAILDGIGHKVDINSLSTQCISLLPDSRQRILYLLRWACSRFRCGDHRIYITLRLLRKWHHSGTDTDAIIMDFLATSTQNQDCATASAFRIVADLIRSKTFSAGKYLQWLIATGALFEVLDPSQTDSCHLRLVTELPFESLPNNVVTLRESVLRHTRVCEEESRMAHTLRYRFTEDLHTAISTPPNYFDSLNLLQKQCLGVKLAISRWLREFVFSRMAPPDSPLAEVYSMASKVAPINLAQFCLIRDALEQAQDFPIIADVLGLMLVTNDYAILGGIADTLSNHSLVFAAIGALVPLLSQLTERYGSLRGEKLPDKQFLRVYINLCNSIRVDPQLLQLLKYDLCRIEQQQVNAVAVCSPASDNLGDTLASANADTDEEFERILSSGTSMDEQMMGRMFKRLVVRLAEESVRGTSQSLSIMTWFPRLRNFDEKTFDRLVQEWVSGLILEHQLQVLRLAIPRLVVSGCFTLEGYADCSTKLLPVVARRQMDAATAMSREVLEAVLPSNSPNPYCQSTEAYRFKLMQAKFCSEPKNLLQLIKVALVLARPSDAAVFKELLTSENMIQALRPVVLSSSRSLGDLSDQLSKASPEAQHDKFAYLRSMFDALFGISNYVQQMNAPLSQQVSGMVSMADEFSLPFCRLEVQAILHQSKSLPKEEEKAVWKALSDAIRALVDKNSPIWFELISGFSEGITRKIRENAEAQILATVPTSLKADPQGLQWQDALDEAALQRHLAVVSFAGPSIGQEGQPQVLVSIIDRLKMLTEFLNSTEKPPAAEAKEMALRTDMERRICSWIDILLRLAVIYKPYFQSGKATTSHLASFLVPLRALLVTPELQQHLVTLEYVFDVAAYFSDDLTDELRIQFSKLELSKGQADPRTAFIFGASPSPDGWLGLISPQLANNGSSSGPQLTSLSSVQVTTGPPSRTQSPVTPNPINRPQTPQQRAMPQQRQPPGQQQRFLSQAQMQMQPQSHAPSRDFHQQQNPAYNYHHQQQQQQLPQSHGVPAPTAQTQSQSQAQQQMPTPTTTPAAQSFQQVGKQEIRPVPFTLRRWEILPDSAASGAGNDTALSLTLFGARRVM